MENEKALRTSGSAKLEGAKCIAQRGTAKATDVKPREEAYAVGAGVSQEVTAPASACGARRRAHGMGRRGNPWSVPLDRSPLFPLELRMACHEAAHALVAEAAGNRTEEARLRGGPWEPLPGDLAGYVSCEASCEARTGAGVQLVVALAGPAYERLLNGSLRWDLRAQDMLRDDLELARRLVGELEGRYGRMPKDTMKRAERYARDILVQHWDAVLALGEELLQKKRMTGRDIRSTLGRLGVPLPTK